jgi:hypothetical protein
MTQVIIDCWLRAVFSITRVNDQERFNSENELKLQPYPLAAYGCMLVQQSNTMRPVRSRQSKLSLIMSRKSIQTSLQPQT